MNMIIDLYSRYIMAHNIPSTKILYLYLFYTKYFTELIILKTF